VNGSRHAIRHSRVDIALKVNQEYANLIFGHWRLKVLRQRAGDFHGRRKHSLQNTSRNCANKRTDAAEDDATKPQQRTRGTRRCFLRIVTLSTLIANTSSTAERYRHCSPPPSEQLCYDKARAGRAVGLTLRTELRGGSGAEANAARRLLHVTWRAAGGVPP
jgi:hypothetical protein